MTEPHESPAQQKKSSAILEAARQHFAQRGFEATKLSEVARDAGVAVGTIYLRYESKAELLGGVLSSVEHAFCDAMDTADIWSTPFPDRFSQIIAAIFETARNEPYLAEIMALSAFSTTPAGSRKGPTLTKIEDHVKDGIARGELRGDVDPTLVARMAYGMVDGAFRELIANPERDGAQVHLHIADAYERWLTR